MRIFYFLLLLLSLQSSVFGQFVEFDNPYRGSAGRDLPIITIGLSMNIGTYLLDRRVSPLTDEDLAILEINKVPGIDRFSTRHFSESAAKMSDATILTTFSLPFLLLVDKPGRASFRELGLITLEGALINGGIIGLTKVLVRRPRPYLYNPDVPEEWRVKKKARYSFFSGHVGTSSYFSFVSAKMYNDFYPDSNIKPIIWGAAALFPLATAYGRMRGGRHFFTDVMTGYFIGMAVGILVPELHKL